MKKAIELVVDLGWQQAVFMRLPKWSVSLFGWSRLFVYFDLFGYESNHRSLT